MNDTSIACFLSVARTGSFTATATELCSTQQAVSRNVLSLEEELGFTLLDRSGHTVELTLEGEHFFHWCCELDRQLSLCAVSARRMVQHGETALRIGWCDWTGCPDILQTAISVFRLECPGCSLDFREGTLSETLKYLKDGELDLAFLPEFMTHDLADLSVSEPFGEISLYIVSGKPLPIQGSTPTMAELTPVKQLAARSGNETDAVVRTRAEYLCALLDIYPEHLQIQPNMDSVLTELLCGPGYTIMPLQPKAARMDLLTFHPLNISVPLVIVRPHATPSPSLSLFETVIKNRRPDHEQ